MKAVKLEVLRHDDALVPQGVLTWVSPVQQVGIKLLTTLPEMHIAVTVDIQSTIKLWDCHNREALATNNLESPCKSLKAVITKDDPIVLVSDKHSTTTTTEYGIDTQKKKKTLANLRSHYCQISTFHLGVSVNTQSQTQYIITMTIA